LLWHGHDGGCAWIVRRRLTARAAFVGAIRTRGGMLRSDAFQLINMFVREPLNSESLCSCQLAPLTLDLPLKTAEQLCILTSVHLTALQGSTLQICDLDEELKSRSCLGAKKMQPLFMHAKPSGRTTVVHFITHFTKTAGSVPYLRRRLLVPKPPKLVLSSPVISGDSVVCPGSWVLGRKSSESVFFGVTS
jgi:hypothetical protein